MARFSDRATQPERGFRDLLRWHLNSERVRDSFVAPSVANDGTLLHTTAASLTWIGHASFALRLGGAMILTDPVWSERLPGLVPRLVAPGVPFEWMPRADIVLVSHNHYDHWDAPTLARLHRDALFIVPLGNAAALAGRNVVELDWWQSHHVGALTITCVPARHWSMRTPWNRNETLWCGFVVEGPEGTAYHSGDTAYFDGFAEIGRRFSIDWAMLPIGAYAPRWFMQPQHMNPEDAVSAFAQLGARHFAAMHWGTFRLTDEPLAEPPEWTRTLWRERGLDAAALHVPAIGETLCVTQ